MCRILPQVSDGLHLSNIDHLSVINQPPYLSANLHRKDNNVKCAPLFYIANIFSLHLNATYLWTIDYDAT